MGAKTAGPANLPATGGNDVPAFDMPPQQVGGNMLDQFLTQQRRGGMGGFSGGAGPQRQYTPEEWSRTFGPNVDPGPGMIRQDPRPQVFPGVMPMPGGQRPLTQGVPGMGLGGQGPRPQMSQDDIIRMMYMSQLGRAPEQGGMDYWRQQLQGGATQDQLRDAFRASQEGQEYQRRQAPMTDNFGQGQRQQMNPEIADALRIALSGLGGMFRG